MSHTSIWGKKMPELAGSEGRQSTQDLLAAVGSLVSPLSWMENHGDVSQRTLSFPLTTVLTVDCRR